LLVVCALVPHLLRPAEGVQIHLPLALLLLADAIINTTENTLPRLGGFCGTVGSVSMVVATTTIVSLRGFAIRDVFKRDGKLLATLELSRRHDVSAVLDLTGVWWQSSGFYYLHRNVLIICRTRWMDC
jgi:hypothetical protein